MPFCNITINATDRVSNDLYIISDARQTSGATDTISFQVQNNTLSLPFDRLYTARLTLSNRYSMQTVGMPIGLSRFISINLTWIMHHQCMHYV